MPVQVKICGITRPEDAAAAVDAGAAMLGFMFVQSSPRCVSLDTARRIIAGLPPTIVKTGVFLDPTEAEVRDAAACGLTAIQLHGSETPEFCERFAGLTVVKAFRVRDAASLTPMSRYRTDAWLLDSYVADRSGGTGSTFDWELAVRARQMGRPIILAGGLTPDNVAEAVRRVAPWGVDVSSGVESAPGRKDAEKMRRFVAAATGVG